MVLPNSESDLIMDIEKIRKDQEILRNKLLEELLITIKKCYEEDGFVNGVKIEECN